jgi:hypothetical protein
MYGAAQTAPFPLIPLLENISSGEVRWRPDWPPEFPPDGFVSSGQNPLSLVLSSGSETYRLDRDNQGRLLSFPCFVQGKFIQAEIDYSPSGEIKAIRAVFPEAAEPPLSDSEQTSETPGGSQSWTIDFPQFSQSAGAGDLGAAEPPRPLRASSGDTAYFVFFFEAPLFISETWYDSEGNMVAYFKADIRREGPAWRSLFLESRTEAGLVTEEYYYDSEGNISEIKSDGALYSALYRNRRPLYWERKAAEQEDGTLPNQALYILQWDERGFLVNLRALAPEAAPEIAETETLADSQPDEGPGEFRYDYESDENGSWTQRQDIEIISRFGLAVPRPGRTWTRRILPAR